MADSKKSDSKKIIDVAHPGQSAPPANSKSVIINNRPLLKDPMVVADNGEEEPAKPPSKTAGKSEAKPVVAPPADDKDDSADKADKPPEAEPAEAAPKEPSAPAEPAESSEPTAKPPSDDKPDTPSDKSDESDRAEDKPEADQADDKPSEAEPSDDKAAAAKGKEQLEAAATEQAKHQEAIDKLADSKQYYLPINTVEKRRSKRFVLLGILLSLLLVIAWADIALDAGLIHLDGIRPLTHFFSN